jgi:hypothetical protein
VDQVNSTRSSDSCRVIGAAWLHHPTGVGDPARGWSLIAEREAARWQIVLGGWLRTAKWSLLGATHVMNTWQVLGDRPGSGLRGGVALGGPPLAVFVTAEEVTNCQDRLTECVLRVRRRHRTRNPGSFSGTPAFSSAFARSRTSRDAASPSQRLRPSQTSGTRVKIAVEVGRATLIL